MELLWGVDVVSFGSDWFGDEVGAGDDQVNLQNIIKKLYNTKTPGIQINQHLSCHLSQPIHLGYLA